MQSDIEYVICKCKAGGGYIYSAYEPAISKEAYNKRLKVHYKMGEQVPQYRRYIGTYPDSVSARAACERHYSQMLKTG